ncbi:transposase [Lysinibacillus sp. UGB7]|uniref:transposase n=1 Tax=Lysinibacillus sp. UGB7 TaxID=3411039 RepID=UPI003B7725A3
MERVNEPIKLIYHMVFVTRYKRTVFDDKESAEIVKAALLKINGKGILQIKSLEMGDCFVKLVCDSEPSRSPNQIVSILKRASYQALLEKMPQLNSLWARSIILRTYPISENELNSFLMSIKRRG